MYCSAKRHYPKCNGAIVQHFNALRGKKSPRYQSTGALHYFKL